MEKPLGRITQALGVPMAGNAGERHARDHRGDRRRREDQRRLRRPRPAIDPAGAGYRRGNPGWTADDKDDVGGAHAAIFSDLGTAAS